MRCREFAISNYQIYSLEKGISTTIKFIYGTIFHYRNHNIITHSIKKNEPTKAGSSFHSNS